MDKETTPNTFLNGKGIESLTIKAPIPQGGNRMNVQQRKGRETYRGIGPRRKALIGGKEHKLTTDLRAVRFIS